MRMRSLRTRPHISAIRQSTAVNRSSTRRKCWEAIEWESWRLRRRTRAAIAALSSGPRPITAGAEQLGERRRSQLQPADEQPVEHEEAEAARVLTRRLPLARLDRGHPNHQRSRCQLALFRRHVLGQVGIFLEEAGPPAGRSEGRPTLGYPSP